MPKHIEKTETEWRRQLTSKQFAVCREKGTEAPFSGDYYGCKESGVYRCICCGNALFSSETKFDSGSGWPSFYAPMDEDAVNTEFDDSHGMHRLEVVCSACGAHLGHVFADGPAPTGQRYCINSVSLKLDRGHKPGK